MSAKHAGKGSKASLKKVRSFDAIGEVVVEHQDRNSIEEEAIKHNKKHFTQAYSAKVHRDKIHHRLPNNETRDRTLNGDLSVEECDEKEAQDLLLLLKKGKDRNNETSLR